MLTSEARISRGVRKLARTPDYLRKSNEERESIGEVFAAIKIRFQSSFQFVM